MKDSGIVKRCDKNWLLRAALIVFAITFSGTGGLAQEPYLWNFNGTYGTYGSDLDTCALCHPGYPFNTAWVPNSYGSDYALESHTFNQALEAADSDGDGFSNIQEINSFTFPGDSTSQPPSGPILETLAIDGPPSVSEGDTASYEASASWSDGSMTTESAVWTVSPVTFATISSSGLLTAREVTSDQEVTVSATVGGMTAIRNVTIADVPSLPAGSITLKPADGAVDVPVNTAVIATLSGSGDIAFLVNDNTFSFSAAGPLGLDYLGNVDPGCVADGVVLGSIDYNDSHTEATFSLPLGCELANATVYTATVTPATGSLQPVLAAPVSSTFTTIAKTPDSDGDGVEDEEDDYPHDNGKGTPPSVRGTGKFLVDTYGNAGIALAGVTGISDMCPQLKRQGKPFGYEFPDGLVRYTLRGVRHGGTVTVTIGFPSGVPKGSKVFKVDDNGFHEWTNTVVNGNMVTVTLTDGGEGDADAMVNGEIVDPIGVAVPAGDPVDISNTVSASGGCSVAGSGGGWEGPLGSLALMALVWLGLALRRNKTVSGA